MPNPNRRNDALSRETIVEASIELLDTNGEDGLTFRELAAHLATGAGAIYWHVANKDELLVAASDDVITRALDAVRATAVPADAIRRIAIAMFAALDDHPWVGKQLFRAPWPTATLQIFERVGRQVQALGVATPDQFTAVSALVSYIIGVSVQNAANGQMFDPPVDRAEVLATEAARWKALDPDAYAFTRTVATRLREHDDRAELLAGVELILAGVTRRPPRSRRRAAGR